MFILTLRQAPLESSVGLWFAVSAMFAGLVAAIWFSLLLRRRTFLRNEAAQAPSAEALPNRGGSSAHLTASMQAAMLKLRDQENELERLRGAEKESAEHAAKLIEEVTRNMPAGLLLVNAAGIIATVNPAAEQALGRRGLAFRQYAEALGERSALTELLARCLAQGSIYRREEVEHTMPGGEKRRLGITISPIRGDSDKITGAVCLFSDLTELVALQKKMQWKENLAALGELSAGIAHEFKNALATIAGYAQMIRAENTDGETAQYGGLILEQTRNLTHVVTEFLKYARPLEIPNEPVSLQPIVNRVVLEVQEAISGVQVTAQGEVGSVPGEEGFLRQAILNLARNAAEAASGAPGGGRVVIQASRMRAGASEVQILRVLDNGPGIPAAALGKIFLPFYTTKTNGTGLGLAVVQKIIVQHGGTIEVRNRPEGGAEFIVTLPGCTAATEAIESNRERI